MCLRRHYITPFLLKDGCIYSEVWNTGSSNLSSTVQLPNHLHQIITSVQDRSIPVNKLLSKCLASSETTRSSRRVVSLTALPVWPKLARVVSTPQPPLYHYLTPSESH